MKSFNAIRIIGLSIGLMCFCAQCVSHPKEVYKSQLKEVGGIRLKPSLMLPEDCKVKGVAIVKDKSSGKWEVVYCIVTSQQWSQLVKRLHDHYSGDYTKWMLPETLDNLNGSNTLAFTTFKDKEKKDHNFTLVAQKSAEVAEWFVNEFNFTDDEMKHPIIEVLIELPLMNEVDKRGGQVPIPVIW